MECMGFHLLTIFCNDTTKIERYYTSNCLKEPNCVPIWQVMQRVQQLNSYLELLPCLFYSPQVTKLTKKLQTFDDPNLASHILGMCPGTWQAQYNLTIWYLKLLEAPEHIEKAFSMEKEQTTKNGNW